ncbi:hypothetical protein HKX48_005178 [Thoreauomyces humboldtii]|nr:hypothetical protein HKX48_005178 [Thoreauomyces humboldtii]
MLAHSVIVPDRGATASESKATCKISAPAKHEQTSFADLPDGIVHRIWNLLGFKQHPFERRTLRSSRDPHSLWTKYRRFVRVPHLREGARTAADRLFLARFDVDAPDASNVLARVEKVVRSDTRFHNVLISLILKFQRHENRDFLRVFPVQTLPPEAFDVETDLGLDLLVERCGCNPNEGLGYPARVLDKSLASRNYKAVSRILGRSEFTNDPSWSSICVVFVIKNQGNAVLEKMFALGVWVTDHRYVRPTLQSLIHGTPDLESRLNIGNAAMFKMCYQATSFNLINVFSFPLIFWRDLREITSFLASPDVLPYVPPVYIENFFLDFVCMDTIGTRPMHMGDFNRFMFRFSVRVDTFARFVEQRISRLDSRSQFDCLAVYLKTGGRNLSLDSVDLLREEMGIAPHQENYEWALDADSKNLVQEQRLWEEQRRRQSYQYARRHYS